jgi:dihydrofolate reductase
MNCGIVEAIDRAQQIAGDRNIQIISADIARQALEHNLIDELQVFVAPVFLGDGTRIFEVSGGYRYDWELAETNEGAERSFGRTYRPRRHRPS